MGLMYRAERRLRREINVIIIKKNFLFWPRTLQTTLVHMMRNSRGWLGEGHKDKKDAYENCVIIVPEEDGICVTRGRKMVFILDIFASSLRKIFRKISRY